MPPLHRRLVAGALLALALSAPPSTLLRAAASQQAAPPQLDEARAALEIDGRRIPWEELAAWLVRYQGEQHAEEFARRRRLERAARAGGLEVGGEELRALVEAQIERRVEGAFGGDREAWRAELERLGSSEAEERAQRAESALVDAWTERLVQRRRDVGEARLRELWEREHGPGGRTLELALLHLSIPPAPPESARTRDEALEAQRKLRAATLEEARALRARLEAGEDFASLARARSDHESAARGGRVGDLRAELGWKNVVEELEGLPVGALSEPLLARGGWNLFLVLDQRVTPFEEVEAELRARLAAAPPTAAETQALFEEISAGIEIELLPELGREVAARGSEPPAWRLDRPVFVVDGEPVTRGEFAAWLVPTQGPALTRAFAEQHLVERLAAEAGLSVSSAEVEQRLRADLAHRIADFHDGDRQAWLEHVRTRGLSEEGYLRMMAIKARQDLLAEALLLARREVDDAELRAEWERRYGPGGRSQDLRWIRVDLRPPEPGEATTPEEFERYAEGERERVRAELEALRARVAAGEDFATLAKLYSQDPATRDRGGRPAGRFEPHTWPQAIQDAVAELEPGQTTPPLELSRSMFVFELVGELLVPLEEVADELRAELRARRPSMVELASFVNELYRQHEVRRLPGLFGR